MLHIHAFMSFFDNNILKLYKNLFFIGLKVDDVT